MHRRLTGEAGWSVAGQAVNSFGNLVLTIAVARASSASEFGLFGLWFALLLIVQGLSRSFFGEVLLNRIGNEAPGLSSMIERRGNQAHAVLLVLSLVAASMLLVWNFPIHALMTGMLAAGVTADWHRQVGFAKRLPRAVFLFDATWTAATVFGMVAAGWFAVDGFALAGLGWMLGALTCFPIFGRSMVSFTVWSSNENVYPKFFESGFRYALDFLMQNGVSPLFVVLVAASAGTIEAGGMRAAQLMLAPLAVVVLGMRPFLLRHMGSFEIDGRLGRRVVSLAWVIFGWVVLVGFLPSEALTPLLGQSSGSVRPMLLPCAGLFFASVVGVVNSAILRLRRTPLAGLRRRTVALAGSVLVIVLVGPSHPTAAVATGALFVNAANGLILRENIGLLLKGNSEGPVGPRSCVDQQKDVDNKIAYEAS